MAKEPERRYAAATLLAADIQRHLDFEPVLASPPSIGYRVQKFVRRYRGQCLAAVAVAGIVTGGVGTWLGFSGMLAVERAESARNRVFADVALLARARAEEAALYPAWPEKMPALRAWLADYGEPLSARVPHLRAELESMRSRASRRAADPQEAEVDAASRQRLRSDLDREDSEPRRVELADQLRQLELAAEVRTFDFPDANDDFVHGTLTRLVRDLEDFVAPPGQLNSMRARLVQADTVRHKTIDEPRAKWNEAIAAIAASDGITASTLYEHLPITPQLGLVPLGMDPESKLWEFVHLASGTPGKEVPTRHPETGRLVATGDMGIVFVLLPGGKLPVADDQEAQHRHSLRLDPFFLSKFELTHGQMLRLTRRPTDSANASTLVLPAVHVSWFDCRDMLDHEALRLPTMVQWEYGCRAGTSSPWWTGSTEASLAGKENPRNNRAAMPVGSLAPNQFGLLDTLGNAWEWTLDEILFPGSTILEQGGDGHRPHLGVGYFSVHHGSFDVLRATNDRADVFGAHSPSSRYPQLGVRPARALKP